jgi:excisionase family DNA binding protein
MTMLIERQRELLSADTIARELDVSDDTVRRWFRQGEIPTVRFGRYIRVRDEDFKAFLRRKIAVTDPDLV